jgi:hypothetical protein
MPWRYLPDGHSGHRQLAIIAISYHIMAATIALAKCEDQFIDIRSILVLSSKAKLA